MKPMNNTLAIKCHAQTSVPFIFECDEAMFNTHCQSPKILPKIVYLLPFSGNFYRPFNLYHYNFAFLFITYPDELMLLHSNMLTEQNKNVSLEIFAFYIKIVHHFSSFIMSKCINRIVVKF